MDHAALSRSLDHQAQALLALQRTIDAMLQASFGRHATVKVSELKRISKCLRQGAEIADSVSVLLDQQVQVPV